MQKMPSSLDGVLLVDKPTGCTSHDVVDYVRRRFRFKKVGHCGTLDPRATGLIILTLERGTKIQDLLMSEDKVYQGVLRLGIETDSQDADGKVVSEKPLPPGLEENRIAEVFAQFRGDLQQIPPMVSALKRDGVPLYKLARAGKVVEREARMVHVFRSEIRKVVLPDIEFEVECSKGFYVRTYCHDIGNVLGCGGHLLELRRTQSGNFSVEQAVSMEQLEKMEGIGDLAPYIISLPEVSRMRRQ
jgi:tRNA pseudouridine55 synthase